MNLLVSPSGSNESSAPRVTQMAQLKCRGHKTKAMDLGKRFVGKPGAGRGREKVRE